MTRFSGTATMRRARQWLVRRMHAAQDGGFILLESIIAISIITVIMGAVGAEFVTGLATSSQQRAEQVAVQLADSTVEQIHALHASDLVTGHDSSSVTTQFAAAPASVTLWLTQMDKAIDVNAAAGAGPTAAIPTVGTTQKPGTLTYTVNQYLGWCSIRTTGSTDCVPPSTLGGVAAVPYLRAVVAVTWTGNRCGSSACTYVTSTLISTVSDKTFRINSAPYSAPSVVAVAAQSNAINDVVSLQLTVQNGSGVPPFTWAISAGALPGGLGLSPTGLISGTVTGPVGAYSATVRVTDAFQRTDTQVIAWTVKAALVLTDPGPQATTTTQTVSVALAATGGDGAPYTFADPTSSLPPGLTMTTAGVISGKPTTNGNYTVQIKLGDKSGTRSATGTFTWSITSPPLAASNPGDQTSTLATAITALQLSASGGGGTYTWTGTSTLPAGLALSAAGKITGTPTATGTKAVSLVVSDGRNTMAVTFNWVIYPKPTIVAPSNQASSVGASISIQLTTTCPNPTCSYAFGGTPPSGLAISSTGLITGTVGTTVKTFTPLTVMVTDSDAATATSATFGWTVNAAPAMASPGNQTTMRGGTVNLDVSNLDSGGTGATTFTATSLPSWLSMTPAGVITGTAPSAANSATTGIKVTVKDASNVTATSAPFNWYVTNLTSSFTDRTSPDNAAISTALDAYTGGGTGPYTYAASGLPSWLTLNPTNGVISGTSPNLTNNSTKTFPITITVTDSVGASITTSPFSWYNTDIAWSTPATISTARGTNMSSYSASTFVTGGSTGKTFSALRLPTGLTMASNGNVTGSTTTNGTYSTVLTVTDTVGAVVTTNITWTVS